jgi:hypothetical protein
MVSASSAPTTTEPHFRLRATFRIANTSGESSAFVAGDNSENGTITSWSPPLEIIHQSIVDVFSADLCSLGKQQNLFGGSVTQDTSVLVVKFVAVLACR